MPVSEGWYRGGLAQAAIRFREPGWLGPVDLCERWQGFPALPAGLVPVSMRPSLSETTSEREVVIQLLNPGSARVRWSPGQDGWLLGGAEASVVIPPGEIQELRLSPQSS